MCVCFKPSCILTAFIPNVFTTQHSIALKLCFDLEIGVQQRSLKTNSCSHGGQECPGL